MFREISSIGKWKRTCRTIRQKFFMNSLSCTENLNELLLQTGKVRSEPVSYYPEYQKLQGSELCSPSSPAEGSSGTLGHCCPLVWAIGLYWTRTQPSSSAWQNPDVVFSNNFKQEQMCWSTVKSFPSQSNSSRSICYSSRSYFSTDCWGLLGELSAC